MPKELPTLNLFMLCEEANKNAFAAMPSGYRTRLCRRDELPVWKSMPFDDEETARRHMGFMDDFFQWVYAPAGNLFFERCLFVVDEADMPVGTCFAWKSYGAITTIAWYKVKKEFEGLGIGRALLGEVLRGLAPADYPVLLHTQPESHRAIKLYSDFGFKLLTDACVGSRENHLAQCLPLLKNALPQKDYDKLRYTEAPQPLAVFLARHAGDEF